MDCPILVSTRSRLASFLHRKLALYSELFYSKKNPYQLLQVPATDLHVALVFIQTLSEGLCIIFAASRTPGVALVVVVGLAGHSSIGLLLLGWLTRSATEHAPDGMTDG